MNRQPLILLTAMAIIAQAAYCAMPMPSIPVMSSLSESYKILNGLDSEIDAFEKEAAGYIVDNKVFGKIFGMTYDYVKSIGSIYYNTHSNIDLLTHYYMYDIYYNQMEVREKYKLPN